MVVKGKLKPLLYPSLLLPGLSWPFGNAALAAGKVTARGEVRSCTCGPPLTCIPVSSPEAAELQLTAQARWMMRSSTSFPALRFLEVRPASHLLSANFASPLRGGPSAEQSMPPPPPREPPFWGRRKTSRGGSGSTGCRLASASLASAVELGQKPP